MRIDSLLRLFINENIIVMDYHCQDEAKELIERSRTGRERIN